MSQASAVPDEPTTLPAPNAEPSPGAAWVDLASHRPGHAVLAYIASLLAPPGTDVQPAGSSPTPEGVEPWAVGFVGEEKVDLELALLDERWRVLHGVPIGHQGSDIDHVVIGPPGVFTINTKHHRGKRIDVRGDAVFIGRDHQRYVPKARHEAECARSALTADLPTPCPVTPKSSLSSWAFTVFAVASTAGRVNHANRVAPTRRRTPLHRPSQQEPLQLGQLRPARGYRLPPQIAHHKAQDDPCGSAPASRSRPAQRGPPQAAQPTGPSPPAGPTRLRPARTPASAITTGRPDRPSPLAAREAPQDRRRARGSF